MRRSDSAPVAQLDRVSGYEPEGRAFESLRARQSELNIEHFGQSRIGLFAFRGELLDQLPELCQRIISPSIAPAGPSVVRSMASGSS